MTLIELIIVMAFVSWLAATVIAAINHQETVSNTLQRWATNANAFGFLFGALFGHWFVPLKQWGVPTLTIWPLLLIPIAILAGLDIYNAYRPLPRWSRYPFIWVSLGIVSGAFLWSSYW